MAKTSNWPNEEMWMQAVEWRKGGLTYNQICGQLAKPENMRRFGLKEIPSDDTVRRQVSRRIPVTERREPDGTSGSHPSSVVAERLKEHEIYLSAALRMLVLDSHAFEPLPRGAWDWASGHPRRDTQKEDSQLDLPRLNSLETDCLFEHMDREDPILVARRRLLEDLKTYWRLGSDLFGELVDRAEAAAHLTGIPFISQTVKPVASALTPEFVNCLHVMVEEIILGNYHDANYQYRRSNEPYAEVEGVSRLFCGVHHIAIGSQEQLDRAETAHRELSSNVPQWPVVDDITAAPRRYEEGAHRLNKAIEIRAQQRHFLPGPCQICRPWGGLN